MGKTLADAHFHSERIAGCLDLAELVRLNPERYPFLLQSVAAPVQFDAASGSPGSRFDILFAFPQATLRLDAQGLSGIPDLPPANEFLPSLDAWWAREQPAQMAASELPFTGGWFLYLGYELAGEVEPGLRLAAHEALPTAFATRIPVALINDRDQDELVLVAEAGAVEHLRAVRRDLETLRTVASAAAVITVDAITEADPQEFIAAVARAKEYIRAGDIFQANLSRRWHAAQPPQTSPVDVYKQLCAANPAPFAGLLVQPDFALVSSSPERLVRRQGLRVDTRPIAGTRPREADQDAAAQARAELLANPKERAEHIMLIDLERNDLGRVCVGGSVEVDEFMVVESYTHVHHIVSNVTGTARAGLTPGELIRAVFPGGTITGCPKVRCMEIIHELERVPRGAYTGSMGYLNLNGDCDLNILIRTLTLTEEGIELAAGSGIVADSDPQNELQETRAKAKGLLLALGATA